MGFQSRDRLDSDPKHKQIEAINQKLIIRSMHIATKSSTATWWESMSTAKTLLDNTTLFSSRQEATCYGPTCRYEYFSYKNKQTKKQKKQKQKTRIWLNSTE